MALLHVFAGTFIMKVSATDKDQLGSPNSKIAYRMGEQIPGGEEMFDIDKEGNLIVKSPKLDREVQISTSSTVFICTVAIVSY